MTSISLPRVVVSLLLALIFNCAAIAQQANPGIVPAPAAQGLPPNVISFSDSVPGQPDGSLSVTFSLYPTQQSTSATWTESQIVQVTGGQYSALLGSATGGVPPDVFSGDQAQWLGVQVNGIEKRFLLVSVPYAMKALESDRLGGLLASQYVTQAQLQSLLQSAASGSSSTSGTSSKLSGPTTLAAASGTTPQPATDFTDNNTSEVLLVTQQGTGFAIHAISAGDAAVFGENNTPTGTGLKGLASSTTGANIGILGSSASSGGIAGVFDNTGGGQILSLRSNGSQVAGVDSFGNVTANQVQANNFVGGGFGLTNIPNSATTATPNNFNGAIVARDQFGNFLANQISALNFVGNGFGLTNIPNSATTATADNLNGAIVARDQFGNFLANQISALNFVGNGFGLTNIPNSATTATPNNFNGAIVARDQFGNFLANQISALNFVGGGFGLTNIPNSATTATESNFPSTIVARDANGGFAAGNLQVINQLTSSGMVDFSGAVTAPVRTVLTANIPPLCQASKELLLVTDAFPGQQLFVCNTNGNGWVLLGDGGGSSASANVSGNTTGSLETVSQLGTGSAFTVSSTSGTGLSATSTSGTAIQGNSNSIGISASTQSGVGLWAAAEATDSTGTSLLLSNASLGKLISGGVGTGPSLAEETFSVDASGNMSFNGALMAPYATSGNWFANSLVKLTPGSGSSSSAAVTMTSPGDTSGAIGIITGLVVNGAVKVAQGGEFPCNFDMLAQAGDYVGISQQAAGQCTDLGPTYPANGTQVVGRVVNVYAPTLSLVLLFGPEQHGAAPGTFAGLTAGDASVAVGGTTVAPTVEVANGGITSAKLASNAVTSANIADASLSPAKITGTAATLGANTFSGSQIMPSVNTGSVIATGSISASTISSSGGGLFTGSTTVNTTSGTALAVQGGDFNNPGLTAVNPVFGGTGIQATSTGGSGIGVLGEVTGDQGVAGMFINQGNGKLISAGSLPISIGEVFSVDGLGNVFASGAQVQQFGNSPSGTFLSQLVTIDANGLATPTLPGQTSGAVGIVVNHAGTSGLVQVAYAGTTFCFFDGLPHLQDWVQISPTTAGLCSDAGPAYPTSGQVIGRITRTAGIFPPTGAYVFLSGPNTQGVRSGIAQINTGAGLTGGPIFTSGTISIPNAGVTNFMLQNSSVTVNPGSGLSGGGPVPLGGSITLTNTGALSFNGRTGAIVPASGDYAFSQLSGTASSTQLPAAVVYNNQSNTFSANQTIAAALTTNSLSTGSVTATGAVAAASFSGDGSALTNVNAASVGGVSPTNLATTTALASETSARQSGDAALSSSIAAETTARQTDTSNLQASIASLSAADAKLAASNTFTAGTQDFSAASATLPVRALTTAQTPSTCVASKELLIKTDAPAGQQLFICDAGGTTWNLVGDGASGGVASFNGRSGSVSPANGDYSFAQISGSVSGSQMPGLTGDVTSASGSTTTTLAPTGVVAGIYSKVSVDAKGRVTSGTQAAFADLSGSAAQSQLPPTVVYNNQANTFSAGQTVNGTISAALFAGNGAGLSNVNAATLNALPSTSFAQLGTDNTFTGNVTAAGFTGNGAGLTGVNAATVNNFQLLKLTASITPASVAIQACSEQSFNVAGVNSSDVILSVQNTTHSPGTNIAIGGWRVSAANTVAIQFCNVSRSSSTPTAGTYTFALMR